MHWFIEDACPLPDCVSMLHSSSAGHRKGVSIHLGVCSAEQGVQLSRLMCSAGMDQRHMSLTQVQHACHCYAVI